MQQIAGFSLRNQGGFDVKLQFLYVDEGGNKVHVDGTAAYPLGQCKTADPGDFGVPDGALVSLYVFVLWGSNNEARQLFTYRRGSPAIADYLISGSRPDNELELTGIR